MSTPTSILQQAQQQLNQALQRYTTAATHPANTARSPLQAAIQSELEQLTTLSAKLEQKLMTIAIFGLVSRGKSAVLNALVGQKLLQTGPIHGVTRWPRAIRWAPGIENQIVVELIDTPGLDEIEGQERAMMARQVAQQADLILFVVAEDLIALEYQAIAELLQYQKPLLLVFNKVDLYPAAEQTAILEQLQHSFPKYAVPENAVPENAVPENSNPASPFTAQDIVRIAAEPAPIQVRTESADGQITQGWETPPPQIQELQERLFTLIYQEGQALLALNVMVQAQWAEQTIATKTIEAQQREADRLRWKIAGLKALIISINPLVGLDVAIALISDLALIRSLARLYALPMTNHEVGTLWKKLWSSAGLLLLGELVGNGLLGFDPKGNWGNLGQWGTGLEVAIVQASLAGYGSYLISRSAQRYLEQGCTWGPTGPSTLIQAILNQAKPSSVLSRFRSVTPDQVAKENPPLTPPKMGTGMVEQYWDKPHQDRSMETRT
jgi:small GTP-binding protein